MYLCTMSRRRLILSAATVVALAFGVVGCGKKASSDKDKKEARERETRPDKPPRPAAVSIANPKVKKWKTGAVQVSSQHMGSGYIVAKEDLNLELELTCLDKGVELTIAEVRGGTGKGGVAKPGVQNLKKLSCGTTGKVKVTLNLKAAFEEVLKEAQFGPGKVNLGQHSVRFQVKAKGTETAELSDELAFSGEQLLPMYIKMTVRKGLPAMLPGEAAKPNAKKAILYVGVLRSYYFGQAGKFTDLDMVAVEGFGKTRRKKCGTYRGARTGRLVTLSIKLEDQKVEVYDRRTGKVTAKKVFRANGRCPKSTSRTDSSFYPDDAKMQGWAAKQVK